MSHQKHESGLMTRLGPFAAFTLVVSAMIGSGVFKKVAPMSAELGSAWLVLLAWFLAGIISWFGAITNAEIAGMIAEPGGQYVWFKRIYGKAFAFFYGWTGFAVVQTATAASVGYVFAESVNTLLPLPVLPPEIASIDIMGVFQPFDNFGVKGLTILLIAALTTINCMGVQYGEKVSNLITITVVACIFFIIIVGIFFSEGNSSVLNETSTETNHIKLGGWTLMGAMFTAMLQAFWAYEGWNNLGFLGGEVKNPLKTIPWALTMGVGFVMLLYMLINFTYLFNVPVSTFALLQQQQNTIAAVVVVQQFLGHYGVFFVLILIVIATLGSTNNTIMTASRVTFAMARDGMFFKIANKVNPASHVPANALMLQGFWACMLVLSGSFDQLTDMLIFAAFIFYGLGAFGVFVLRVRMKDHPRPFRLPGYPWVPAIFVVFCVFLLFNTVLERPRECAIGLCLILSGLPFYLYWSREKA